MIIPLFLHERGLLSRGPHFHVSDYLEARRGQYIEMMCAVSRDGAWTDWCAFFLQAVIAQASDSRSKAQRMLDLRQETRLKVAELTRSRHADGAVECIFSRPIFASPRFVEDSGIPRPTALRILGLLRDEGILRTIRKGAGRRHAIYAFPQLLRIVEERSPA